jgi:hypothetical protein
MPRQPLLIVCIVVAVIHELRAEVFVCINEIYTKGEDEFVELAAYAADGLVDSIDLAV